MLQALLHGKLSRDQENAEDILTSNVFGLLRYLPAEQVLLPFLSQARALDRSYPLAWLCDRSTGIDLSPKDYDFWPFWNEPGSIYACEPDLVIRLRAGVGRKAIILIECKYRSGKSPVPSEIGVPPKDQLAREWDNLIRVAKREEAEPFLIYLTRNTEKPESEIQESIRHYRQERGSDQHPVMLWLTWQTLDQVLCRSPTDSVVLDLLAMLNRMRLVFFHGVRRLEDPPKLTWRFNQIPSRWWQGAAARAIQWRCPNE